MYSILCNIKSIVHLCSSMSAPPFVGRLFPVSCPKGVFLYEQIILMIKIIHDYGGFVYLVMSDDHSVNQNTYQLFTKILVVQESIPTHVS